MLHNFMENIFSVRHNTGRQDGLYELMILGFIALFIEMSWKLYQVLTDTIDWSRGDSGLVVLGGFALIIFQVYRHPKKIQIQLRDSITNQKK